MMVVTLRLPLPIQPEGAGLVSDVTHAQSLSGGDPERVATRLGEADRADISGSWPYRSSYGCQGVN